MTARCPNAWARHPDVTPAIRAWNWREKGALAQLYPLGIPAWLAEALDWFDDMLGAIDRENDRIREERREDARREMEARVRGG